MASVTALVRDVVDLVAPGRRLILGITGAPGAGKSTLAGALVDALGERAALVGMDGFHFAQSELERLGRTARKGAADTFDAPGYVHLLRRLRSRDEDVVHAPRFDRHLEEPIGSAVPVSREVDVVITEGNYLLLSSPGWSQVRPLLDQCWFVDPGDRIRRERLVARHITFGRTPEAAAERTDGSDQVNAELVAATRDAADRIVTG